LYLGVFVGIFGFAITAISLARTFGWHYCEQLDSKNCRACPNHANCTRREFVSAGGYDRQDRLCINQDPDSEENRAWRLVPEIETCLRRIGRKARIESLRKCLDAHGDHLIELAVNLTGKWTITEDRMIKSHNDKGNWGGSIVLLCLAGIFWILLGISLFCWRRRLDRVR
jgi:hypothetical protein